MKFSILSKVGAVIAGALFALTGASSLYIADVGKFQSGRSATIALGCVFVLLALACFAFLYSRRLAKVLGVIVLLAFAAGVLWLSFLPVTPAPNPVTSQVAAIALCVLLVARVVTTWRAKRRKMSP